MDPIVSTEWLAKNLDAPGIRICDASWYMPADNRNPRAEFEARHIPGAVFFDIDDISDETSALPHMMPGAAKFASRMRSLGIGDGHRVVVYDGAGIFSAPRAWWMLRQMGHEDVAVLDGGLPKWLREGKPVTDTPTEAKASRHFTPRPNANILRSFEQVSQSVRSGTERILDARSYSRFSGEEKEPRPGLKSGHMPGALNVPFRELLTADNTMKSPDALAALFAAKGINLQDSIVTTCGSGISAAILMLGLQVAGGTKLSLYDGSWSEWGGREGAPVETA